MRNGRVRANKEFPLAIGDRLVFRRGRRVTSVHTITQEIACNTQWHEFRTKVRNVTGETNKPKIGEENYI